MAQVYINEMLKDLLDEITDTGNLLDGADAGLFVNDVTPTFNSVVGDLTVPSWTGYGNLAITWNAAYINQVNRAEVAGNSVFFLSGADADEIAFGYFILDGAGNLAIAERFANPVPFSGVSGYTLVPVVGAGSLPS